MSPMKDMQTVSHDFRELEDQHETVGKGSDGKEAQDWEELDGLKRGMHFIKCYDDWGMRMTLPGSLEREELSPWLLQHCLIPLHSVLLELPSTLKLKLCCFYLCFFLAILKLLSLLKHSIFPCPM